MSKQSSEQLLGSTSESILLEAFELVVGIILFGSSLRNDQPQPIPNKGIKFTIWPIGTFDVFRTSSAPTYRRAELFDSAKRLLPVRVRRGGNRGVVRLRFQDARETMA